MRPPLCESVQVVDLPPISRLGPTRTERAPKSAQTSQQSRRSTGQTRSARAEETRVDGRSEGCVKEGAGEELGSSVHGYGKQSAAKRQEEKLKLKLKQKQRQQ